ncbi:hypothetical protein E5C26_13700 [Serratia proteamaculans]|nr:hypothetical protein E5C26_13700 [Serratia proteamaculans]
MTKLSLNPRYPGLAHRGALRRASRYDPFGTLSLITGFVSSLSRRDLRLLLVSNSLDLTHINIRNAQVEVAFHFCGINQ